MLLHVLAVVAPLFLAGSSPLDEAQASLQAGRREEALALFKKAASRDKRCGACFFGMAEAQLALREYRDAVKSCSRALELEPADARSRARAHNLRGMARFKLAAGKADQLKDAEADVRQAAALDPTDDTFAFNLGAILLGQRRDDEGKAQLQALLERVPKGPLAESARRFIENPRRARERFAPDFRAVLADGQEISLQSLKGKVVVLDFWATWCPPCRESIPDLKELVRKYGEKKFVLLSISVDHDEAAWRKFLEKHAMTWPQCRDQDLTFRQFEVNAFPTYIVLDGEGAVRLEIDGTDDQRTLASRLQETLESMPELSARIQ
jgi:thioredoxin-like negative regulator of GroEL